MAIKDRMQDNKNRNFRNLTLNSTEMNTKINETLLKNCKEGDLEGIQYCIKAGADVNYRSDNKDEYFSPIDYAVFSGNRDAVQYLIDNDVLIKDTCIIECIGNSDNEMMKLLLTGDLSDLNLGALYAFFSSHEDLHPDDTKAREDERLFENTLCHLLKLAYISKKIINVPVSLICSIIDYKA
ncbi:MAG: ankyrin repeat domain-containing protein [Bacteroidales bacterium]|jgi:ankyrin repeat protein|nr:ankyrin repeat domain-containing protein [Bacteroidales bacterium]